MPELPEVESLRLKLSPQILGQKIKSVTMRRKDLRYPITKGLDKNILAKEVVGVRRRSKYLLVDFSHDKTWVVHLGMSGRLFFTDPKNKLDKHDHVVIQWQNGKEMRYRDPRRFGMMFLLDTSKVPENKFFKDLGVEPLSRDFNPEFLLKLCQKSQSKIKPLLMNAKYIVGVGNIYASESLFLSKVHPERIAKDLSQKECKVLCENIKQVLKKSIKKGGTTFKDYIGLNEEPGLYRLQLQVYGRAGESCHICKKPIESIVQVGRTSFFCPKCQS